MKNKYFRYAKIPEWQSRQIFRLFANDQTATQAAKETRLSLHSINAIFQKIRQRLAERWEAHRSTFSGAVQVNEHYFGTRNAKGPPGRGASKKILVLGIMDMGERVHTLFIEDCCKTTLHSHISEQISPGTTIITTRWRGYSGLDSVGYPDHRRVRNTYRGGDWDQSMGVNITSFWRYTRSRIAQFGGVPITTLPLHILESEFRWNNRRKNLYKVLLGIFQANPL